MPWDILTIKYRTHNPKKTKLKKTVCIFYRIYSAVCNANLWWFHCSRAQRIWILETYWIIISRWVSMMTTWHWNAFRISGPGISSLLSEDVICINLFLITVHLKNYAYGSSVLCFCDLTQIDIYHPRWRCDNVFTLCVCLFVSLSRCLSGRFNYEGPVPHKQYFAGALLGMSSCASYVSRTHAVIDDVTRSQSRSNF